MMHSFIDKKKDILFLGIHFIEVPHFLSKQERYSSYKRELWLFILSMGKEKDVAVPFFCNFFFLNLADLGYSPAKRKLNKAHALFKCYPLVIYGYPQNLYNIINKYLLLKVKCIFSGHMCKGEMIF